MMLELDVMLDKKSLGRFLLFHNYARVSGILGVVISAAAVVALALRWGSWSGTQKGILIILLCCLPFYSP